MTDTAPDLSPEAIERLARGQEASRFLVDHQTAAALRALAARVDTLTKENTRLGRDVNVARYGEPDFGWSIHQAVMDDLRTELGVALSRVDELTKEGNKANELVAAQHLALRDALAGIAAVQRENDALRAMIRVNAMRDHGMSHAEIDAAIDAALHAPAGDKP